jgi:hypothetical protein
MISVNGRQPTLAPAVREAVELQLDRISAAVRTGEGAGGGGAVYGAEGGGRGQRGCQLPGGGLSRGRRG